ncbi:hypothetical protein CAPTEDRAFT_110893 [Capitella teleta]|uniref:Ras-related protein Rab n=1 Tax=Capitella teleta TaxID=283909 RepID=R7TVW8_CAPTE|nr:hypothetical protein CAPTEDRAFT_110893 [Capitella teleta]|eukprot:ELT98053.1 hypothetical protein CAPTEDRAFT_110893 [Capitella teleta]
MDPLKGKDSCVNQVYPKEYLFKVLVIGEFGVGKTSIIRRYTEGYFVPSYKMTIGVDFSMKSIPWNPMTHVNIQLWDIAGHERFGHMTRVYYKYAMAAIVVFDLSRSSTLEAVSKWIEGVRSKVMLTEDDPIPCFLFANKCDIDSIEIDTVEMNNFCQQNNIETWFPTSAKDDINIGKKVERVGFMN